MRGRAVLQAPPGAGKTTVVPLAMRAAGIVQGRILMLEPRRLAARAAAERMAETLGEKVGETVGYRVRGESRVGKTTRIEVVTEGILTRMIQSDAELSGIGAVIFDEFHERSLNGDLGLALCLEIAGALRDDLMLLVMSATLDAGPVAELMGGDGAGDVPVITSAGRAYEVEPVWLGQPRGKAERFETAMAELVVKAVGENTGGVLVFLPGEGEIRRVEGLIKGRLPKDCVVRPLFGAMKFAEQRAAIEPAQSGRKIVLATSIAETSLTISDVRVVVDGGQARRARFDPGSGMSRLVTERVSKAEATQRMGRAGRVAKGTCYRLWSKGEEGAMAAFAPAEIDTADLSGLALELALWGAKPEELAFLTPPNVGGYGEALALLTMLGALDADGRITAHGRVLAALPLHPRLAHMVAIAGGQSADLAALLADRDPLGRGAPVELALRVEAVRDLRGFMDRRPFAVNRGAVERIKVEARRLGRQAKSGARNQMNVAEMAALAYPDRIGARRKGDVPRFVLSGGKGAVLPEGDPLSGARLIVATDLDGDRREARIRQATAISEAELRGLFGDQIAWVDSCAWSKRDGRVVARRQLRFGAVILADQIWKDASGEDIALAMLDGVREIGVVLKGAAHRFAARVLLMRGRDGALPDMTPEALIEGIEAWLLPHLNGVRTSADWRRFDLLEPLRGMLTWEQMQALDRAVPAHFISPLGNKIPIDYEGDHPQISLRIQEMFGQTVHPTVAGVPLRVTLLSPARKPVQTTLDIPGFWTRSYGDVRRDMRGRYPKHPWPEDPTKADPTLRVKRFKPG